VCVCVCVWVCVCVCVIYEVNMTVVGVDVRRRGIWAMYGPQTRLEETSIDPTYVACMLACCCRGLVAGAQYYALWSSTRQSTALTHLPRLALACCQPGRGTGCWAITATS
jgi:hypothetical protein